MDKFTKEQQVQAVYDLKVGYALGHADIAMLKSMARQLLASMEQEPVLYAAKETLAHAKMGELHLKCLSSPMGEAVIPLYAAPQLPQPAVLSVPDGVLKSLLPDAEKPDFWFEHNGKIFFEGVRFNNAVFEACRAAMLQGAEPASNCDELPLDYLQGHKDGLEWAAQLAKANHPETGDWLYGDPIELSKAIRKGPDMPLSDGNSPVIQDGWIKCSERMPEDEQEVLTRNRMGHCFVSFFDEHSGLFFDRVDVAAACCIEHILVTHWMPLPAAPQQEE